MLIRVRKDEIHQFLTPAKDNLQYCLECWSYFMSGTGLARLDAKPMGGMTANEDGYGRDPNEAQLAQDSKIGAATNAEIYNLDNIDKKYRQAISKTLGIGSTINFTFSDLLDNYNKATELLKTKLKQNYDTGYLF